jgi:hypothetical protein
MEEKKIIILSILKNFLGEPKTQSDIESRKRFEFNCPSNKCKHDVDKFNLVYNIEDNIYKCWKCKDKGIVHKLVEKYGSKEDFKNLKTIMPNYISNYVNVFREKTLKHNLITCPLPEGYTPLLSTIKTLMHKQAYDYVTKERKLTEEQILKYKIGYTEIGEYKYRIIIPSFNEYGVINYFEARTFLKKMKPPYYKPNKKAFPNKEVPEKYDIIFNEKHINWDLPIYLVEGVFDMFRIPNSIPMLGKTLSSLLISKLVEYNSTVTICLDEDAFIDSNEIYEQLSSLELDVYFVDLKGFGDISYHYEKHGHNAIVELLKTRKKIDFFYKMTKLLIK